MAAVIRTTPKKLSVISKETKSDRFYQKEKLSHKKIIQHLVHPDYILFDWEFYSNALEFE